MNPSLRDQQALAGAVFSPDTPFSVPLTYGNDAAAQAAVATGVAIVDRSHWGRLRVSDRDRIRFLHNQTTNHLELLQPGQGCDTVFVTSTARTLDLATAYVGDDSVLLWVSPGQVSSLMAWMDRYIFFADKVKLGDETDSTAAFTLMGSAAAALVTTLGMAELAAAPHHSHRQGAIAGVNTLVAVGSGLAAPGYTLICPVEAAGTLWTALVEAGAVPLGEQVWEQLRIVHGRPMPGAELTEDINPLEAGLWHAISFDKGCYIGQETIARLNTYQGVKQQLWGLRLSTWADAGTPILLKGDKVGMLTSVATTPDGICGLGYLRTKAGGAGLTVTLADAEATVVEIPFASRGYLAPSA